MNSPNSFGYVNRIARKPRSKRFHIYDRGIGPIQRDLYPALLAAYLEPLNDIPSIAHYDAWESAELRLRAAMERLYQRANEGQDLPRSMGIPHLAEHVCLKALRRLDKS